MDLELLQKLKDSGFPIKEETAMGWTELKAPSLSELIEACGDRFEQLIRNKRGVWMTGLYETEYKTPEETVAKLWLALNAKPMTKPTIVREGQVVKFTRKEER
jgi:hypothetical protein